MGKLEKVQRRREEQRKIAGQLDDAREQAEDRGGVMSDVPLSFESPESSTILGARYNPSTQVLTVEFKRGLRDRTPKVYTYADFPAKLWVRFCEAESKGKAFGEFIRNSFPGVQQ